MARRELVEEQKRKILDALREAASRPGDLSLKEIAQIRMLIIGACIAAAVAAALTFYLQTDLQPVIAHFK